MPNSVPYELRIVGRGPLDKHWRNLARRFGMAHNCQWLGWIAHEQILAQYYWADVFVFTSLRDTSGNTALEALSCGVPVICLDHQGIGDIITNDCGVKVQVTNPKGVILGLRDAILSLSKDNDKLERLSHGALARAKEYLWSRNGEKMAEIYREVFY